MNQHELIDKLYNNQTLSRDEFVQIIKNRDEDSQVYIGQLAQYEANKVYGKEVYPRGLIEFTNYCKNDCLYCGIRASNSHVNRYRLNQSTILETCHQGYDLGYRSFVLQGGEDPYYKDELMTDIVAMIRKDFPDCAITLSLGERSYESYQALYDAGADRYLLRHETASEEHYKKLHPASMSLAHRKECLYNLKDIGYAVGTGFMVGAPYQTAENLADDLLFIKELEPKMVGIGPFVPHHETPFKDMPSGTAELTTFLISILRLMNHHLLLPSTTSLGTIEPTGREQGILAGANVVMPNLSPVSVRGDYELYDNKICTGEEAAECKGCLGRRIESIGYRLNYCRGDYIE
ncbi:MAG: [FeFe] hydrogenase H-cluster radical SAM maturase HydE [Anaerostipes sp.]|nr:[FeFe] hydrogenase H-cluster radical SAM maturase HydE [Anaerostipes sp.]